MVEDVEGGADIPAGEQLGLHGGQEEFVEIQYFPIDLVSPKNNIGKDRIAFQQREVLGEVVHEQVQFGQHGRDRQKIME